MSKRSLAIAAALATILLCPPHALPAQALERLFYYVDREDSYQSLVKNIDQITILGPQVYTVDSLGVVFGELDSRVLTLAKAHRVKVMPLVVNEASPARFALDLRSGCSRILYALPVRAARTSRSDRSGSSPRRSSDPGPGHHESRGSRTAGVSSAMLRRRHTRMPRAGDPRARQPPASDRTPRQTCVHTPAGPRRQAGAVRAGGPST